MQQIMDESVLVLAPDKPKDPLRFVPFLFLYAHSIMVPFDRFVIKMWSFCGEFVFIL